jgi:O-antigen ligase
MSGLGAWTSALGVFSVIGILVCGHYPRRLLGRVVPYLGFLTWIGISLGWALPDFWGVQNGILYILFGSLVIISGVVAGRDPGKTHELVRRCMLWIDSIALAIVLASLVVGGLPTAEGVWWFGPRGLALLGLIPLSWHLAGWYYGVRGSLIPVCLWLAAIALSLSRTATAVSLLLFGMTSLLQLRFRRTNPVWSTAVFLGLLIIAGAVVRYSDVFRGRLFGGDTALAIGTARINTEGRLELWDLVASSARRSPMIGNGLGSSQAVVNAAYPRFAGVGHPHNDYLRMWHDFGLIGLLLFVAALGGWLVVLFRRWYRAERWGSDSTQLELSATLGLLGVLLAMLTDNVIVYVFAMGPLGVLVGAGLGLRAHSVGPPIQNSRHAAGL